MDETTQDKDSGPMDQKEQQLQHEPTLLEQVRKKPAGMYLYRTDPFIREVDDSKSAILLNPIGKETQPFMELIHRHRSEFPSAFWEGVANAEAIKSTRVKGHHPEIVEFEQFEYGTDKYLFGCNDVYDVNLRDGVPGMNDATDSMEAFELVLRFCPHPMDQEELLGYAIWLMSFERAISFIPVVVKLAKEQENREAKDLGLCLPHLLRRLLISMPNDDTTSFDPQVDQKYLQALKRLKELVSWDTLTTGRYLLRCLIDETTHRDGDFIEERVRLLIGWSPSLLRPGAVFCKSSSIMTELDVRVFGVMLELGMLHFPTELGFLFHTNMGWIFRDPITNQFTYCNSLSYACQKYGSEIVAKVVREVIMRTLGRIDISNHKLRAHFVVLVLAKNEISWDGKYALIRCANSMMIQPPESPLPKVLKQQTGKRKASAAVAFEKPTVRYAWMEGMAE